LLGQPAELAGLSKRAFIELLGEYGFSIVNYPISDLHSDIGKPIIVVAKHIQLHWPENRI
jgi:hypothetical protein